MLSSCILKMFFHNLSHLSIWNYYGTKWKHNIFFKWLSNCSNTIELMIHLFSHIWFEWATIIFNGSYGSLWFHLLKHQYISTISLLGITKTHVQKDQYRNLYFTLNPIAWLSLRKFGLKRFFFLLFLFNTCLIT